jgi:hypothetical protein
MPLAREIDMHEQVEAVPLITHNADLLLNRYFLQHLRSTV